jgi:hypothetical protein
MNPYCLNCGKPLLTGQQFCAQCGQKAETHRISLHEISHDAIHYFTHADKGIFHLLKALTKYPGRVAGEYIGGKRKLYFKPLNFFLIVAGILVFMSSTFYQENPGPPNKRYAQTPQQPMSPELIAYYKAMGKRAQKVNYISGKYGNVIMMLATPLLTWFLWLCYKRGRFNYLEHLVANMYFSSFIMLFYALILVPLRYVFEQQYIYFLGIFFAVEITYRGIAYYQFMGRKGKGPLFKAIGISLLASAVWFTISFSMIWYYIRNGF